MRVLFISKECESIGIAQRIIKEGHQVRFWCKDPSYRLTGYNIIDKVEAWRPSLPWADLIVVDTVGFSSYKKVFDEFGKPVFACSIMADLAELDRSKGLELFQKAGIRTPKSWFFHSPDEYRLDEEAPKDNVVVKPCGNMDCQFTRICKTKADTDYALHCLYEDTPLLVQEIVEGITISTEGWFNGRHFIKPFNHTIEQKHFLEDDKGPATGCEGNLVWTCDEDEIVQNTVLKLEDFLKRSDYVGPIDINAIVNEEGVWALEPTFRLGYDAIEALCEGLRENMIDLLFETAAGTKKEMNVTNDYLIAVRVSVPPYPYTDIKAIPPGRPIDGLIDENLRHIYLTDVYRDSNGIYRCAGADGVVMKVTARGRTIREARRRVYRTINNISIHDMQYRKDIAEHAMNSIETLEGMGYLTARCSNIER
jgi:phosphoribosylamine--glycine ligase